MNPLLHLAACLALTVAVECGAAALLLRSRRGAYAALLGNLLTNPLLNGALLLLLQTAFPAARTAALALLECGAVAGEAALYRRLLPLPVRRAAPLSLLLNALSFGAGQALACIIPLEVSL